MPDPREEPWEWHADGPEALAEEQGDRPQYDPMAHIEEDE